MMCGETAHSRDRVEWLIAQYIEVAMDNIKNTSVSSAIDEQIDILHKKKTQP